MIPVRLVGEANLQLFDKIQKTPVTYDNNLGVFIKWENHQKTGSFKLRGALNKVLSLDENQLKRGLVTCSAGNHGQGVAYAARMLGAHVTVFASHHAAAVKVDAMQRLGAEVVLVDGEYVDAEKQAIQYANGREKVFISPYNDELVIAGQGTIGIELLDHFGSFENIQSVVVPVGGGGLLSGMGILLRELKIRPALIGVQSEASAFAYQLMKTGSQEGVIETDSIAEGLAGEIDPKSITIPLIQKYASDIVLVSEREIKEGIVYAYKIHHEIIAGSAAVGLAACLTGKISTLPAVIIVTGGNIQPELHSKILLE